MFVDNTIPELTMGQKLKMFREINNLSQEQLGQKLNVTDKTISAWETGEREINLTNAKNICELFNIPNSYFVFNENFKSINDKLQNQIRDYIKDMEFRNKVELSDLINCNNLETFKTTLAQTKSKKYTQKNIYNPFAEGRDISSEHLQSELNKTLENLNPNLSKFWEIIVYLIDNGAYYTKQIGRGDDVVCWKEEIDISKTNLVYRLAKDKTTK